MYLTKYHVEPREFESQIRLTHLVTRLYDHRRLLAQIHSTHLVSRLYDPHQWLAYIDSTSSMIRDVGDPPEFSVTSRLVVMCSKSTLIE